MGEKNDFNYDLKSLYTFLINKIVANENIADFLDIGLQFLSRKDKQLSFYSVLYELSAKNILAGLDKSFVKQNSNLLSKILINALNGEPLQLMNQPKLFGIYINWKNCSMMISNIFKILLVFPKVINISELNINKINIPQTLTEKESGHFISIIIAKKPRSEIYYNYCFNPDGIDSVCDERNISFSSYEQMVKSIILFEVFPVFVFYSSNSVAINLSFDLNLNLTDHIMKFAEETIKEYTQSIEYNDFHINSANLYPESQNVPQNSISEDDWKCEYCQNLNKIDKYICKNCNRQNEIIKDLILQKESINNKDKLINYWECPKCNKANTKFYLNCEHCHNPRQEKEKVNSIQMSTSNQLNKCNKCNEPLYNGSECYKCKEKELHEQIQFRKQIDLSKINYKCKICLENNIGTNSKCKTCRSVRPNYICDRNHMGYTYLCGSCGLPCESIT